MKLLILDKDETLITPKSGHKFAQHSEDQELIPGAKEAIDSYRSQGWDLAIASNQGGVALGYKSMSEASEEIIYLMQQTGIDKAMFAPSYELSGIGEAEFIRQRYGRYYRETITNFQQLFRKPNPGMINFLAANLYGSTLWRGDLSVLYVGDRPEDQQAARAAKVDFLWASDWIKRGAM